MNKVSTREESQYLYSGQKLFGVVSGFLTRFNR